MDSQSSSGAFRVTVGHGQRGQVLASVISTTHPNLTTISQAVGSHGCAPLTQSSSRVRQLGPHPLCMHFCMHYAGHMHLFTVSAVHLYGRGGTHATRGLGLWYSLLISILHIDWVGSGFEQTTTRLVYMSSKFGVLLLDTVHVQCSQ